MLLWIGLPTVVDFFLLLRSIIIFAILFYGFDREVATVLGHRPDEPPPSAFQASRLKLHVPENERGYMRSKGREIISSSTKRMVLVQSTSPWRVESCRLAQMYSLNTEPKYSRTCLCCVKPLRECSAVVGSLPAF